ncbi:MAG: phosphate ABC transporter permease subunit PstC [Alphaproteobacteria bacterium]
MIWLILFISNFLYYNLAKTKIKRLSYKLSIKPVCNPHYYGLFIISLFNILFVSSLLIKKIFFLNESVFFNISSLLALNLFISFIFYKIDLSFNARQNYDLILKNFFLLISLICILISSLIIILLFKETLKFFHLINVGDFLFGLNWSPQTDSIEELNYSFGVIPVLLGTLLIVIISIIISVPIGILSAIYLSEYASNKTKLLVKPVIEILSAIPTIVYGYFAALIIGPKIRNIGEYFNINISTESALNAGIVMGIMIIPFVMSLSYEVFNSISKTHRDASFALGATKAETITKIILPSAMPNLLSVILLAISRAIGETMIVTMASGLAANLTFNPLNSVTSLTAQIVLLLTGDQEFNSPKTLAAFGLAFILFVMTLILNLISFLITKKYSKYYE